LCGIAALRGAAHESIKTERDRADTDNKEMMRIGKKVSEWEDIRKNRGYDPRAVRK
jgi:hypothetical protein